MHTVSVLKKILGDASRAHQLLHDKVRYSTALMLSMPELSLGFLKQEFRTPIWQKVGVPLEEVGVLL